jgi:hypothetical protein
LVPNGGRRKAAEIPLRRQSRTEATEIPNDGDPGPASVIQSWTEAMEIPDEGYEVSKDSIMNSE